MRTRSARLERGAREHGEKWNPASLERAGKFWRYYESGERIRVRFKHGEELTGTVSTTSGWVPAFMLMRTARSMGSSWLLGPEDEVIAVKRGRTYVDVPRKGAGS